MDASTLPKGGSAASSVKLDDTASSPSLLPVNSGKLDDRHDLVQIQVKGIICSMVFPCSKCLI